MSTAFKLLSKNPLQRVDRPGLALAPPRYLPRCQQGEFHACTTQAAPSLSPLRPRPEAAWLGTSTKGISESRRRGARPCPALCCTMMAVSTAITHTSLGGLRRDVGVAWALSCCPLCLLRTTSCCRGFGLSRRQSRICSSQSAR